MSTTLPGYDAWLTSGVSGGMTVQDVEDCADDLKLWGQRGCTGCDGIGVLVDDEGDMWACWCSVDRVTWMLGEGLTSAFEAWEATRDEAEPLPDDGKPSDAYLFGAAGAL